LRKTNARVNVSNAEKKVGPKRIEARSPRGTKWTQGGHQWGKYPKLTEDTKEKDTRGLMFLKNTEKKKEPT